MGKDTQTGDRETTVDPLRVFDDTPDVVGADAFRSANAKARRFDVVVTNIGPVRIRSLNEAERSEFETDCVTEDLGADRVRLQDAKRRLIVACVVDKQGNPILNDDDVADLGQVDGAVIGQIYNAARKLCGFSEADIESLVKNSVAGPAGDSN